MSTVRSKPEQWQSVVEISMIHVLSRPGRSIVISVHALALLSSPDSAGDSLAMGGAEDVSLDDGASSRDAVILPSSAKAQSPQPSSLGRRLANTQSSECPVRAPTVGQDVKQFVVSIMCKEQIRVHKIQNIAEYSAKQLRKQANTL